MLEDYLKKLESTIAPQTYSKQNYKSKFNLNNTSTQEGLSNEIKFIEVINVKPNNIIAESKIRVYNKMLESPEQQSNVNITKSMSPNLSNDKERIHQLSIKNMNYRHEIEAYKNNLNNVTNELEEYKMLVSRLEKQKDNDNKYLLKLEHMLENKRQSGVTMRYSNGSKSDISRILNKNNYYNVEYRNNSLTVEDKENDNMMVLSDKEEVKQYVLNMLTENRKLKYFQNQVYDISKNYDDINLSMLESIKNFQTLSNDQRLSFENEGKLDLINNFDKILETVEKTLYTKNIEYNMLIDTKDLEIDLINSELKNFTSEFSNIKKDRIRDQKIINELEIEIDILKSQLKESGQNKSNILNQIQQESIIAEKMEKKVLPAKQSVQKIVKRIEKTFDLQDKNNVKLLANINKKLK